MKKAKILFKTLLSLWIIYNIFTMLVMPNLGSYLGRSASRFITPYANTVGLNAGWNFFSPDPAHTMYIRYIVRYIDEEGNESREAEEGFFPAEKNQSIHDPTRKRDLYAMRYMVIEPKRLRILFGPWLCRQHPGASIIDMEHVIETVPILDQVVSRSDSSIGDLSQELQYIRESHSCFEGSDEELL